MRIRLARRVEALNCRVVDFQQLRSRNYFGTLVPLGNEASREERDVSNFAQIEVFDEGEVYRSFWPWLNPSTLQRT